MLEAVLASFSRRSSIGRQSPLLLLIPTGLVPAIGAWAQEEMPSIPFYIPDQNRPPSSYDGQDHLGG